MWGSIGDTKHYTHSLIDSLLASTTTTDCVAPNAANILHSEPFWAMSSASVSVMLWGFR